MKFRVNSMSSAHNHQMAELLIALLDADILVVVRFEAVIRALFALSADLLVVRVHELVDLEDDGELLPRAHDVVAEEEDVDGVREGRRGYPWSLSAVVTKRMLLRFVGVYPSSKCRQGCFA